MNKDQQEKLNNLTLDLIKYLQEHNQLEDGVSLHFESILIDGVDHYFSMTIYLKKK